MRLSRIELSEVPQFYRASFRPEEKRGKYAGSLEAKEDGFLSRVSKGGITLELFIESRSRLVRSAAHTGAETFVSIQLLDRLCEFLIGKPVNECHDHALIFLEYQLRAHPKKRPHSGITTPFNSWTVFKDLTDLVRAALQQYKKAEGYTETKNFYIRQPSSTWLAMSKEERIERASEGIREYSRLQGIDPAQIRIVDLTRDIRLVLDLKRERYYNHWDFIMGLEAFLKERVEPTLCLYLEEAPDRNLIRWDSVRIKQYKEVAL